MDRVELSFKNPIVKVWFMTVLPALMIAIPLYLLLPIEQHIIPRLLLISAILGYEAWKFTYKRKKKAK